MAAIGDAMKHFYIHGDSSCEGIIMRAGQPFAMRYPLVEVDGNGGTLLASGNWAAPRYTSARLSPIAEYLFKDIDKNVIKEWRDNYDNTEQYPMVLPSKGFFNLVNGGYGIGVGASGSLPQYNLKELNEALITLLNNPDASFDEMLANTSAVVRQEVEMEFALSNRIYELMTARGLTKLQFAKALGKKPSEITKWLSGQHNFTLKTISMLSVFFGEPLIKID